MSATTAPANNGLATCNDTSVLANLPSDVFTALTSTFDLAAISVLRQVSHSLNAATTNELFAKCFAHRTTDLSTKSLNDLISVCSSEFGSYVQSITVRASCWRLDELEKQLKEKKKWVSTSPGNGPIFSSECRSLTDEQLAAAQENFNAFKDLNTDQAALKADGKVATWMAEALQALGDRTISINLEAAQYRESLTERLPARSLYGQEADQMQAIMNDALKATISAIAQSNVNIEKLLVFDLEYAGHVSIDGLYESFANLTDRNSPGSSPAAIEIPRQLHKLKSLTLNLSPSPYIETRPRDNNNHDDYGEHAPAAKPELHEAHLTSLRALFGVCASTLTTVDIRVKGSSVENYADFATLFSSLPSLSNLSTLHLRGCVFAPSSLLSLLKPATNLTTLGLHRFSLSQQVPKSETDTRAWLLIFSQLATMPTLTTFEANALYFNNFHGSIFPNSPASALARIPKEHYTARIYFEGCPCVTFTGEEIRAKDVKPDKDAFEPRDDDGSGKAAPMGYDIVRWGAPTSIEEDGPLDIDEVGTGPPLYLTRNAVAEYEAHQADGIKEEKIWTPIRYKIGKRRPLGSPWLYRWMQMRKYEYCLF